MKTVDKHQHILYCEYMKPETAKIYLSGIGILSLAFFFWLFLYQMFVNVDADVNTVNISFERAAERVEKGQMVSFNVIARTPPRQNLSDMQLTLQYPPTMMSFESTLTDATFDPGNEVTMRCLNAGSLSKKISVSNDAGKGKVTIRRAVLDESAYRTGVICFGTVLFKVKDNPPSMGTVSFADMITARASGPNGNYGVAAAEPNSIRIDVLHR